MSDMPDSTTEYEIIGVIQGDAVELACFDLMVGWLGDLQCQYDLVDVSEEGGNG